MFSNKAAGLDLIINENLKNALILVVCFMVPLTSAFAQACFFSTSRGQFIITKDDYY